VQRHCKRLFLGAAVPAAVLATAVTGSARVQSGDGVDLREARMQPCTRAGVATSLMAFFGLMEEGRFAATRSLWLPRSRLEYAYILYVGANGTLLRTRLGAEIPDRAARWVGAGGTSTEVVAVDARINRTEPRRTGFAVWWIRSAEDGSDLVLGTAKGVWDCERHRIGRLVGSERASASVASARAEAAGHCGRRGSTTFRRYGQSAALCKAARGASG
jgi:hypothetical protein